LLTFVAATTVYLAVAYELLIIVSAVIPFLDSADLAVA
jgi:hypothetical protein